MDWTRNLGSVPWTTSTPTSSRTAPSSKSLKTLYLHGTRSGDLRPKSWEPRWVLVKKRNGEGVQLPGDDGFKGRCVVNGKLQKCTAVASGKEIFTFMPTMRTATNKLQCANAVRHGRRITQADIKSAYLMGKFEDGEVVYVRPPPNAPGQTVENTSLQIAY